MHLVAFITRGCHLFTKEFLYTSVILQEPSELECLVYSSFVSQLVLNLSSQIKSPALDVYSSFVLC